MWEWYDAAYFLVYVTFGKLARLSSINRLITFHLISVLLNEQNHHFLGYSLVISTRMGICLQHIINRLEQHSLHQCIHPSLLGTDRNNSLDLILYASAVYEGHHNLGWGQGSKELV